MGLAQGLVCKLPGNGTLLFLIIIIFKTNTVENLQFLKKLKIELPLDPPTALLGMYPREVKHVHTRSHTQMFRIALLATKSGNSFLMLIG